ncbi:MAG: sodium:solute symporter, partial [Thermomonas sp.]
MPSSTPLLGIISLDEQPVAVMDGEAWRLDQARGTWIRLRWPAQPVHASRVVTGSKQAWLLTSASESSGVNGVVRLDLVSDALTSDPLPVLPGPLLGARGASSGDHLSIAGIGRDGAARLLRLQISADQPQWTALAGWPGGGMPTSLVAQSSAVFITMPDASGKSERLLRWNPDVGWKQVGTVPGCILPGSGFALGQANAIYLVRDCAGVDGPLKLMTFQTITSAWATLPGATPVNVLGAGAWKDGIAWARRDETGLGIRFDVASVQSSKVLLKWLDWLVILVYLSAMVGIGLYFYLQEKRSSTADFFVGGRSIPFWAAGISLYATNTSSISFIAIPAKAFETNWQYLTNNLIAIIGLMFVAVWIVPLLRRLDLMSVFSYLETRFHPAIRMLASALCIVMQIGSRMSVILFLPSLAIATITGIDVLWSILIMGGFTILYTTLGGMKAVIWTDFVQVFVMFGGALFAIG